MIPNSTDALEVKSNITGESGQFTVDENALAHIMDVLTNLYSDPERAVVREYLTNAYDSQVEAGMVPGTDSWKPIEVTTPSHFNKSYIIRDYGIGMSVDDLKNIYSKYGKSTKRQNNDVVGMLGLGSKCALTYTHSFTITGIKDGVQAKAIVSKNEENIPVFHIVDTRATDEPNGVIITVPVKDRNSFEVKTRDFLRWWQPGLVTVNGAAPRTHNLEQFKPGIYLVPDVWDGTGSKIVMGNVAYDIDPEYVPQNLKACRMGFVAYVEMGDVNFAPSREKLFYNARTKETINKIAGGLYEHIISEKIAQINAAPDHFEAWKVRNSIPYPLSNVAEIRNASYKGDTFVDSIQHTHGMLRWNYDDRSSYDTYRSLNLSPYAANVGVVITGVDLKANVNSYFRRRVRHYLESNNLPMHAVLVEDDITSVWFKHIKRVTVDDIKNVVLPKSQRSSGPRNTPTYDVYESINGVGTFSALSTMPSGKTLVYISPADMREARYRSGTNGSELCKHLPANAILVVLATNRMEKFRRDNPKAISARSFFEKNITDRWKAISDADFIAQRLDNSAVAFLTSVSFAKIKDPDLIALAKVVRAGRSKEIDDIKREIVYLRRADINITLPERDVSEAQIMQRYPLLDARVNYNHHDHLVIYCNAVYKMVLDGTMPV